MEIELKDFAQPIYTERDIELEAIKDFAASHEAWNRLVCEQRRQREEADE